MTAEAMMVATGRKEPPREWFDTEREFQASHTRHLENRLARMMKQGMPRGYQ